MREHFTLARRDAEWADSRNAYYQIGCDFSSNVIPVFSQLFFPLKYPPNHTHTQAYTRNENQPKIIVRWPNICLRPFYTLDFGWFSVGGWLDGKSESFCPSATVTAICATHGIMFEKSTRGWTTHTHIVEHFFQPMKIFFWKWWKIYKYINANSTRERWVNHANRIWRVFIDDLLSFPRSARLILQDALALNFDELLRDLTIFHGK